MDRKRDIYIIGHRNPDTDSICSAIAYADIKNRTEKGRYVPMRAGQINEETEFVLRHFGIKTPGYLPDAATTVGEIEIHHIEGVDKDISVKLAWEKMQHENVVTIPITSRNGSLEGLITVSDIAKSYMDIYDSSLLANAKTQYSSIADTLDGEVITGNAQAYITKGKVRIGVFHSEMLEQYIEEDDLVIVGNRAEDQLACLDRHVSCMVVGLGAKIGQSIRKLAMEQGMVVISSPHDTYTIARLINQSIPISYLMTSRNLMTFHLSDKVKDIEKIMKNSRHRDYPILDHKGHYVGTISRRNLLGVNGKRLILVDHNEKSQAVLNVEEARVLEILDHHKIATIETMSPILFRNQPVGCTCTIMYQIYQERELEIPKKIAGLMCSAILSDTLLFRSPTCTPQDEEAARSLAKIADIEDLEAYASAMFRAGSNLLSKSAEEIFHQDFKKFIIEKTTFGVGQISSMDKEELENIRGKLMPQLTNVIGKHDMHMVFFMLTNIIDEETELIYEGKGARELVAEAFSQDAKEHSCILPGVVSRKKQLIPAMMKVLQEEE